MGLEHTRHRCPVNALVHILSCLAAYTLAQPKVNIGNIPIPNPHIHHHTPLLNPYPVLGLNWSSAHSVSCLRRWSQHW